MIFETHAHYDDEAFDEDRDELIPKLLQEGIGTIVNVGASIASTKTTIALAEKYPKVYAAAGVHPSDVGELDEDGYLWLKEQAAHEKVIAIGEIGLDYYWVKEKEERKRQRHWFARQMELAKECALPVIIHSRDAAEDTLKVMKEVHAKALTGVIHCYGYSPELAEAFLDMGTISGSAG